MMKDRDVYQGHQYRMNIIIDKENTNLETSSDS